MYFLVLLYFSPLIGRCWLKNKMISWFIKLIDLQTTLCLSCLEFSWEVDINWLLIIKKSYVKVNFKERNNNDSIRKFRKFQLRLSDFQNIHLHPLIANPTKWLNTLTQFIGISRRIVWRRLTTLWGWCLKGEEHH